MDNIIVNSMRRIFQINHAFVLFSHYNIIKYASHEINIGSAMKNIAAVIFRLVRVILINCIFASEEYECYKR